MRLFSLLHFRDSTLSAQFRVVTLLAGLSTAIIAVLWIVILLPFQLKQNQTQTTDSLPEREIIVQTKKLPSLLPSLLPRAQVGGVQDRSSVTPTPTPSATSAAMLPLSSDR